MSDDREHVTDELGSYSLDDEDQLQPEDTLDAGSEEGGVDDVLDRGFSPPDGARSPHLWGTTAYEQRHEETIDQRIAQEIPDPHSAYGAPDNESGLDVERIGGDDPDAIDADEDWVGGPEVGRTRAGRLVAPDEGVRDDDEDEAWGRDVGIDGAAASAEEAAVHIIDDEDDEDE
ncbi:MAG TPA: hypothetical protein GXZ60_08140 [Intrasporangiaceae bacterium]|nr:hypothetical protein [Intrasporangiaceae bacterium]